MNGVQIPISVIFTTFNEEHNIAAAIDSVIGWASEVIVVDSFSIDKTPEIVKRYDTIKFVQRAYLGPAFQKNWAIPQAQNTWVLLMDADERLTPALRSEIEEILRGGDFQPQDFSLAHSTLEDKSVSLENNDILALHSYHVSNQCDCYWIGFTHYFMGKKIRYSGWQNDKTIRLIKRDKCRYNDNLVHEEIRTDGLKVGLLKNKFEHFTFKNINHFLEKQKRYARWSAEDKNTTTTTITYYHLFFKPIARFFKHFIIRKGFLDGKIGFIISAIAAWSVFQRYVFMMELRMRSGSVNHDNKSVEQEQLKV